MPAGGETALHMAAVAGRTAAARVLLDAGADPNLHARSGVATSMFDGSVKLWGETPLHYAAAYGDAEMIQAMLLAAPTERPRTPTARRRWNTPTAIDAREASGIC